jgi:ABC-type sugar transport system substrate-binding protein
MKSAIALPLAAMGALRYLQENRRSTVMLAGYDALGEAVPKVKTGKRAAPANQQAGEQGFAGVHAPL